MTKTLYVGEFDSERYWRESNLAKLPSITDKGTSKIVQSMDEILFVFCDRQDMLITRFAFNETLKKYLSSIGFGFRCNLDDIQIKIEDENKSIFEILVENRSKNNDVISIAKDFEFSPYSITPCCIDFVEKFGLNCRLPSVEVVKKVNSKVYSTKLSCELGFSNGGDFVENSTELLSKGKVLLEKGSFLIKDPFGVSGKGNIYISSLKILERIEKYISTQETNGREVRFVIEPYLDKEIDFSCGFIINKDGSFELESIQKILNNRFSYAGSVGADKEFIEFLDEKNYFDIIGKIAKNIYNEGYIGEVCVDSMVQKDETIVPIIEINARKSMGFINNRIDKFLHQFGMKGNLVSINIGLNPKISFDDFMDKLDKSKLLFYPENGYGILPVSANTLFRNQKQHLDKQKMILSMGRMYFSAISNDLNTKDNILTKLYKILDDLSCKVYN